VEGLVYEVVICIIHLLSTMIPFVSVDIFKQK
jgi:hypothetical protein